MSDLVSVVRSLPEALAQVGGPAGLSWGGDHFLVRHEVVAAASVLAGLFVVCPNCRDGEVFPMIDGSDPHGAYASAPCDACRGGVVIKPEAIEKHAKAAHAIYNESALDWVDEPDKSFWRGVAELGLWAVFGGEE